MTVWARVLVALISLYQRASAYLPRHCRFEPSCSEYARQAVWAHGARHGAGLALRRIGRCHPWSPGGLDPVPLKDAG